MKEFIWEVTARKESGQHYLQGNAYSRLQELFRITCRDLLTFFMNFKSFVQNSFATFAAFYVVLVLVQSYQEIHIKHANEKKKV